ncbi:MAG: polysaccharide deacetylase family protein [Halanaerobiales bacterium]|nr:polysaccharide deacetylase family protein [Halanaerobiales bacterium]
MKVFVIQLKKSYYWTLAALLVMGLFWYTDILSIVNVPVSGIAPYYHGDPKVPNMSLTINVDWGEEYIPLMLEILQQKNVKATFFITGKWVEKFPDLVRRIHKSGHEIGLHGYSHVDPTKLTYIGMVQHIKKNEEVIFNILGIQTNLYAPPSGDYNKSLVEVANELGYKLIRWSADTIDWQRPSPQVIINRVMRKASNGGIVLMHPIEQTVQALPKMIDNLQVKGYQLVTVSKLLQPVKSGEQDEN